MKTLLLVVILFISSLASFANDYHPNFRNQITHDLNKVVIDLDHVSDILLTNNDLITATGLKDGIEELPKNINLDSTRNIMIINFKQKQVIQDIMLNNGVLINLKDMSPQRLNMALFHARSGQDSGGG